MLQCRAIAIQILCASVLASCASAPRVAFTEADQMAAVQVGGHSLRFWADSPTKVFEDAARRATVAKGPLTYLALSGGGGGGAFGAGVLNGWTQSGTRPEFTIVSGVSVGALIAPFAFLGPDYDDALRRMYTDGEASRTIQSPNPLNGIFGGGFFGEAQLQLLVARYVDDKMIEAIAREDRKGRRLLAVTTNLDAQRAVIWDMGAIAASGGGPGLKLFREVLAASASVPVVFAPQLIDVEVNGSRFTEMHVDGTVSAPVFTLPDSFLFGGKAISRRGFRTQLYVIINAPIEPSFEVVPNNLEGIASRSFAVMNRVGAQAVLVQTSEAAAREGMNFHLTYIDKNVPEKGRTGFETETMRRLYEYGYQKALGRSLWETRVPQIEVARDAADKSMRR